MEPRTLSHYEILERIGAGGMGVVYRARDPRLQRDVAVKVLPPDALGDGEAARRFRAEAILLSQLNHPNVATVFDFDTAEGEAFLVMELVTGETLEARLARGALPVDDVVRWGLEIAEALAAAHARGVIHRDLKPANLRLTEDGRVKVLDFGLARLLEREGLPGVSLTMTRGVHDAGTLGYLAPEVLAGGVPDERADIYALGVVLYEMATGRMPFEAASPLALMYAMLHEAPRAPRAIRPELPAELEALVQRALERDPARRWPSASALAGALRKIAGPSAPQAAPAIPGVRSLAVLPLDNLSGDPAQEFFSDGMTEALIADLAKLRDLRVISRTSVMRYKGVRKPLPEIAAELRVDAIVEGSVIRSGSRVRVTAQLIQAASDTHLWAERYDREMDDVLALQSEISGAITEAIRTMLSGDREKEAEASNRAASPPMNLGTRRRVDPVAYEAYLKGLQLWPRRTEESVRRAAQHFRQAIELAPDWAEPHVGLADTHNIMGFFGFVEPRAAFPEARESAQRALELDPSLGEAHSALAYVLHYYDWNFKESEAAYRRGVELSPSNALVHLWFGNVLTASRRFEEARNHMALALELDPLAPNMNLGPGWVDFFSRSFDRAEHELERAADVDPAYHVSRLWYGWTLFALGRNDDAMREFERSVQLSERAIEPLAALAAGAARRGDHERARAILADLETQAKARFIPAYQPAIVLGALGDLDAAFAALERAREQRVNWMTFLDVDPRLDPLRDDPRFADLRRRTLG